MRSEPFIARVPSPASAITSGIGTNGVLLLGEAWGEAEEKHQTPFKGAAGLQLGRMLAMGGWDRDDFLITNCCSFRPPGNRPPTPVELEQWRPSWEALLADIRVIVPLGNSALAAVLQMDNILDRRGYIFWSDRYTQLILPTVHPSYILRGNQNWTAAWLRDIGMAVQIAREGPPAPPTRMLTLDIPVLTHWGLLWQERGHPPLAVDIETQRWHDEEDGTTGPIVRIGFAYRYAGITYALSVPWSTGMIVYTTSLLSHGCLVWNRHFDIPRLRHAGVMIPAPIHDVQEMWHLFQTDLLKKLVFAAPFVVPGQPFWKDLHVKQPAFYNATDAAVTVEAYERLYG